MTKHCCVIAIAMACSGCADENALVKAAWTLCREEVLRQHPTAKLAAYDAKHVRKNEDLPYAGRRGYKVSIVALKEPGDTSAEGDWSCYADGETAEVKPAIIIDRMLDEGGPTPEDLKRYGAR